MRHRAQVTIATLIICTLSSAVSADPPKPLYSGEWVVMSIGILTDLAKTHTMSTKMFESQTAGVAVDRTNGDVYLLANTIGICKSIDQGQMFSLVSGNVVTGRMEYGFDINIDPMGGRLMCFSIYGTCGYSSDAGKTWAQSKTGHLDYGSLDWSETGKTILAICHENKGTLILSQDAGASWTTLGTGHWGTGMFDGKTLLTADFAFDGFNPKPNGFSRSTDGGQTWAKVSDEPISAPVMVNFKGVGYWLGDHGLLVSKDRGATWTIAAQTPAGACLGPMFGADEQHMVVVATDGLYESKDSGKTWALAVLPAPNIKVLKHSQWAHYAWDPIHSIFYASQMGQPAYKFVPTPAATTMPAR